MKRALVSVLGVESLQRNPPAANNRLRFSHANVGAKTLATWNVKFIAFFLRFHGFGSAGSEPSGRLDGRLGVVYAPQHSTSTKNLISIPSRISVMGLSKAGEMAYLISKS